MTDKSSTIDFSVPYNMKFDINGQLREQPVDPSAMASGVAWLARQIDHMIEPHASARLYGMHGAYSRILGRLDVALISLEKANALAESFADDKLQFINELRLGHVYQWQQRFAESNMLFNVLVKRCESTPSLSHVNDFALQHAGYNAFDQGRYEWALTLFESALELRQAKKDATLIDASRHAMQATRRHIIDRSGGYPALRSVCM